MASNGLSVAEYVVNRLADLGIDRVFGVPGDYSFPFDDAIEACDRVEWIVCANELNAAYAADGYARIQGAAILSTTYGVGELRVPKPSAYQYFILLGRQVRKSNAKD